MLKKRIRKVRTYGMAAFAVPIPQCLGCGTMMNQKKDIGKACCDKCDTHAVQQEKEAELENRKRLRDEAWDVCRKCQGGNFEKVTCSNVGCDNFFKRDRTIIDIEDMEQDCKRFKK